MSVVVLFLVSCGGDHADGNHSASGPNIHSHSPKSQENLLNMLEETDSLSGEASVHAPTSDKHRTVESVGHTTSNSPDELETLLGRDSPVAGEPAHGAESNDHGQPIAPTLSDPHMKSTRTVSSSPDQELEDLLSKLNNSKVAFERQINSLKAIVDQRDHTINSLKLINQKLRDELNRLRNSDPERLGSLPINGEVQLMREELLKLKNSFTLKVKELDELREYNNELYGRLENLDPTAKRTLITSLPTGVASVNEPSNSRISDENLDNLLLDSTIVAPRESSGKEMMTPRSTGSLEFDAVVTAANGKIKEAFYTEFFIAKYDLREILEKAGINLDNPKYKNITSFAELWAQSRKYPFRYPDLQKEIRKALLDSIDDEKSLGRRIRTDIDGNSDEISGLATGNYYIIGTASLGQVGVTWSVPVKVKSGRNKVSLTIANASWSL